MSPSILSLSQKVDACAGIDPASLVVEARSLDHWATAPDDKEIISCLSVCPFEETILLFYPLMYEQEGSKPWS